MPSWWQEHCRHVEVTSGSERQPSNGVGVFVPAVVKSMLWNHDRVEDTQCAEYRRGTGARVSPFYRMNGKNPGRWSIGMTVGETKRWFLWCSKTGPEIVRYLNPDSIKGIWEQCCSRERTSVAMKIISWSFDRDLLGRGVEKKSKQNQKKLNT